MDILPSLCSTGTCTWVFC